MATCAQRFQQRLRMHPAGWQDRFKACVVCVFASGRLVVVRRLLVPLSALLLVGGCTEPDPPPVIPTEKPTYQPIPPVTEQPTYTSTGGLPPTTAPASVDPSPTAFVTPTVNFPAPAEGETPEERAVRDAFEEYHVVFDTYSQNPDLADTSEVERVTVAGSVERQNLLDYVTYMRDRGAYLVGVRSFRNVVISMVTRERASVAYCQDASATRLYDIGSPVPTSPINPTLAETMVVEKGSDGVWRTSEITAKAMPC